MLKSCWPGCKAPGAASAFLLPVPLSSAALRAHSRAGHVSGSHGGCAKVCGDSTGMWCHREAGVQPCKGVVHHSVQRGQYFGLEDPKEGRCTLQPQPLWLCGSCCLRSLQASLLSGPICPIAPKVGGSGSPPTVCSPHCMAGSFLSQKWAQGQWIAVVCDAATVRDTAVSISSPVTQGWEQGQQYSFFPAPGKHRQCCSLTPELSLGCCFPPGQGLPVVVDA